MARRATAGRAPGSQDERGSGRRADPARLVAFEVLCASRERDAYANLLPYLFSGEKLYMWGRPDGAPRHTSALCSPARMLASSETHWRMAGGYFPSKQITYQTPASWLPVTRIRFDMFVDHLSRRVLGRPSTTTLLQACIACTGLTESTYVTSTHKIITTNFGRLMSCFLEAPAHMSR